MKNLLEAYDLSKSNEQCTGWLMFCGSQIGVSAEDNAVRVWDPANVDVELTVDTAEVGPRKFVNKVEKWVHTEVASEVGV